jgi:CRP/FNR family transcriptional regulator
LVTIKNQTEKNHTFLHTISLFKNIDDSDLIDFFNLVQVRQYNRGEMITLTSKQHAKCYIVYEGLLKLVKTDERGNEIVIDIADKTDVISAIHFSEHYDIYAEFVKKTTLLYFDKNMIDELSIKSHQFSINIINLLAENMQKLMLSAEVLQLKTAKEKVGWYLARSKINNTFQLAYSKSLIASYLGMRSESFSRALLDLKKEGVHLNNKTISLDNGSELCRYCDKVIGSKCTSTKTKTCVHN